MLSEIGKVTIFITMTNVFCWKQKKEPNRFFKVLINNHYLLYELVYFSVRFPAGILTFFARKTISFLITLVLGL